MSDEDGYFDIDKKTCPICLRRSSAYALDACGHMGTCEECFHLARYPICTRKRRDGTFCGRSAQDVIRVIR